MACVRSNNKKPDSAPSAALIEIARLLARQVARELAERPPEGNQPAKPTPSEDRS
jgi:hypothetical protein